MRITLTSDDSIRLEPEPGQLTIEAPAADTSYSPFHMLASALAVCTFSVLYSWASHAGLEAEDLVLEVQWTFADAPNRVATYDLAFTWPSLPAARREVARRVATLCPVHATLSHPPAITIRHAEPEP